jgi:hypothetical protein
MDLSPLQAEAKKFVEDNREALVKKAEGLLAGWHSSQGLSRDVIYMLNDQDCFFELFEDMPRHDENDLYEAIGEADLGDIGDIQVWIDAAKNLGFQDYVVELERVLKEGI